MRKIRVKNIEKNEAYDNNTLQEEQEKYEKIIQEETNDVNNLKYSKHKITAEHLYNFSINLFHFIFKTILVLFKASGIYLLWICFHYFAAHLYIKFCVPNTIIGFLMSPFMIATPHCQGLRWIVFNAAGIINNMWILIGAWIYSMIWIFNKDNNLQHAT
jgi:hypothetical protein